MDSTRAVFLRSWNSVCQVNYSFFQFNLITVFCLTYSCKDLDVFNRFVRDCCDETVAEGLLPDTCVPKVTASFLEGKYIKSHVLQGLGAYGPENLSGLSQESKSLLVTR